MAASSDHEIIQTFLDNDLYKINMQAAILQHFPSVEVEYTFINRSPHMRLNRMAAEWLQQQIIALGNLRFSTDELAFLRTEFPYLPVSFLDYLMHFRLRPVEQVTLRCHAVDGGDSVDLHIHIKGLWLETIPYEVPLLALISEAYFKFADQDWDHEGQIERAYEKAVRLLTAGCIVSDFGSRRRRDFKTQDIVIQSLARAASQNLGLPGRLFATSNVYFARKYGIPCVGTVAHEWYMCIAAIHDDHEHANERALQYWLDTWGPEVLSVALTDTYGTSAFFKAFAKPVPGASDGRTYAHVFQGLRQDSGDPKDYVRLAAQFYDLLGITGRSIVFSDGLNVDSCIEYKSFAEEYGFRPSFGVGTHFTNDFDRRSDSSQKSKALNIVIKVARANGRPCIKLSDEPGKHTGDFATIQRVKLELRAKGSVQW